jgi:predicted transcriptional regulator
VREQLIKIAETTRLAHPMFWGQFQRTTSCTRDQYCLRRQTGIICHEFSEHPAITHEGKTVPGTAIPSYLRSVSEIVSAFVAKNAVAPSELPALIHSIHSALHLAANGGGRTVELPTPAVPTKKSITPDYLISLEDGGRYKSLKRHLRTSYGMTPEEYRAKWGLPADYPMVAPNYAKRRSELAKSMGLGLKRSMGKSRRKIT